MDVLSTAMRAGMTVYDLEKLELSYAPPYSSAKDPVNIAGFAASNILKKDCSIFHWDEVGSIDSSKSLLVDVRAPEEFDLGTIKGAVNIPLDEIRDRLSELSRDKEILIFCQVGLRGYLACRILMQKGYSNVKNLSGGYKTYQMAVQKQSNEDIYEYDKIMKNDDIKPVDSSDATCAADVRIQLDACGLQCPGPIMKVYEAIKSMNYNEVLEVKATDPAFQEDIRTWCRSTGNKLLGVGFENNSFTANIRKEMKSAETIGSKKKMTSP